MCCAVPLLLKVTVEINILDVWFPSVKKHQQRKQNKKRKKKNKKVFQAFFKSKKQNKDKKKKAGTKLKPTNKTPIIAFPDHL